MPLICYERPAIRLPALGPVPVPASAPMAPTNNDFFQEYIRIFMEGVPAPTLLAVLIVPAPDVEPRDNIDRPLKPLNPKLYYSNLHIK